MENPFSSGVFVSGEKFYDRKEIGHQIFEVLRSGENALLYGPRRYGKSSLALQVIEQLSTEGHTCIYFDLMKVNSLGHLLQEFTAAVYAAENRRARSIRAFLTALKGLRPRVTMNQDGTPSIELDFASAPPTAASVEEALNLSERLAGKKRAIVVFDEFQEIAALSDKLPLERIFRSAIQRQHKTNYLFLGSQTHLLKRMFMEATRPFYQSATPVQLGKPPIEESRAFVRSRFRCCGVQAAPEAVKTILDASENIPYYLQALCATVWRRCVENKTKAVTLEDAQAGIRTVLAQRRDLFEALTSSLAAAQRQLICALARERTAALSAEYRARHRLDIYSTTASAMKQLLEKGLAEQDNGLYRVADPFFEAYLKAPAAMVIE